MGDGFLFGYYFLFLFFLLVMKLNGKFIVFGFGGGGCELISIVF